MQTIVESSDGDLARAVAARGPSEAEAAESELYRRFAPRVRLYGLRHLRDEDAARDLVYGCSSRSRPPAPRAPNSAGTCSTTQRRRYPRD
jgi:hypothetical protein